MYHRTADKRPTEEECEKRIQNCKNSIKHWENQIILAQSYIQEFKGDIQSCQKYMEIQPGFRKYNSKSWDEYIQAFAPHSIIDSKKAAPNA